MSPEQELDLLVNAPPAKSVISFGVAYPGSPKTYIYAAIEAAGQWYITGEDGSSPRSWPSLVRWLKNKNAEITYIRCASSWEDLL